MMIGLLGQRRLILPASLTNSPSWNPVIAENPTTTTRIFQSDVVGVMIGKSLSAAGRPLRLILVMKPPLARTRLPLSRMMFDALDEQMRVGTDTDRRRLMCPAHIKHRQHFDQFLKGPKIVHMFKSWGCPFPPFSQLNDNPPTQRDDAMLAKMAQRTRESRCSWSVRLDMLRRQDE